MALRLLQRSAVFGRRTRASAQGVVGTARIDRRTKRLASRLKPGNIAVIDHDDLDWVSAESLLEHGVIGVVNARQSISGRYPNLGPLILVRARIPLLDGVGQKVFDKIAEGDLVRLDGNKLYAGDHVVAEGVLLDEGAVVQQMDAARRSMSKAVEHFTENTLDWVRREQDILLDGARFEDVRTVFKGRHALVVTRGYHYKEDLRALRMYIREMRPVVVAVDGAADACLAEGFKPDVIVGDMDSISATALRCGAELFVHPSGEWRRGDQQGEVPEPVRQVRALGLSCHVVTAPGTSEDVAMLLAHEEGADLVVAVGSHSSLVEFLDKGRKGMASTFLVRQRLGPKLVDAKGVWQLYRSRVRTRDLILLVVAAFVLMVIVSSVTPQGRLFWVSTWELVKILLSKVTSWI